MPFWNRKKPKPQPGTYDEIHGEFMQERGQIIQALARQAADITGPPSEETGAMHDELNREARRLVLEGYNIRVDRLKASGISVPENEEWLLKFDDEVLQKVRELQQEQGREKEGPEHGEGHERGGRK